MRAGRSPSLAPPLIRRRHQPSCGFLPCQANPTNRAWERTTTTRHVGMHRESVLQFFSRNAEARSRIALRTVETTSAVTLPSVFRDCIFESETSSRQWQRKSSNRLCSAPVCRRPESQHPVRPVFAQNRRRRQGATGRKCPRTIRRAPPRSAPSAVSFHCQTLPVSSNVPYALGESANVPTGVSKPKGSLDKINGG